LLLLNQIIIGKKKLINELNETFYKTQIR